MLDRKILSKKEEWKMSILLGVFGGLAVAYMLYKLLFDTLDEFWDCVRFWFTPEIISLFRGQYYEDMWAELKLVIWLVVSIGCGYGIYAKLV